MYSKQIKLIGSHGGTRKQIKELIEMYKELKIRVWKKFKLDEAKEALQSLFVKNLSYINNPDKILAQLLCGALDSTRAS